MMELTVSEYFVDEKHYFTGILRDIRERRRIIVETRLPFELQCALCH